MTKSLQKSAKRLRELDLPHPGILDPTGFHEHFDLRCYEPPAALKPFLVHIWTQRIRSDVGRVDYQPLEVLSGPNVYLFFTPQGSFIHGIAVKNFKYNAHSPGVIAGVKFRPGGFYPFWQKPLSVLAGETLPVTTLFPEVDEVFTGKLLAQTDQEIVRDLEALLLKNSPTYSDKNEQIDKIMEILEADPSLQTVAAVAHRFGRSERSLQLLFQMYVGVPLKWVLARRRLLRAVQQFHATPDTTWTEVTAELGYSSQSHFTHEFTEVLGQSPSQYLKNGQMSKG